MKQNVFFISSTSLQKATGFQLTYRAVTNLDISSDSHMCTDILHVCMNRKVIFHLFERVWL